MHSLKEQDGLIQFILDEFWKLPIPLQSEQLNDLLTNMQALFDEHFENPSNSRLRTFAPSIAKFFRRIDIIKGFELLDSRYHIRGRSHIKMSFREARQLLNFATIISFRNSVNGESNNADEFDLISMGPKLVCFDADCTIYDDQGVLAADSPFVHLILSLLNCGVHVAIVTAASYPDDPSRYIKRLHGLFDNPLFAGLLARFYIMGGEANYLLRVVTSPNEFGFDDVSLELVEPSLWKDYRGVRWVEEDIQAVLRTAMSTLESRCKQLGLSYKKVLKDRACGILAGANSHITYEVLEDIALSVKSALVDFAHVPHCVFNGGNDVFVDIGNKGLGIKVLQGILGFNPSECVHIGDQFTATGNDFLARESAMTLWISNPKETEMLVLMLLTDLHKSRKPVLVPNWGEDRVSNLHTLADGTKNMNLYQLPQTRMSSITLNVGQVLKGGSRSSREYKRMLPSGEVSVFQLESPDNAAIRSSWEAAGGKVDITEHT